MDEKAQAVMRQLLPGPPDDDNRCDHDYAIIRANAELLDEEIILGLFAGAEQSLGADGIAELQQRGLGATPQHVALEHAERMYEVAQRIAGVKGDRELEARAASFMAGVAEQRGRVLRAADGYEIVRRATKESGDESNYLIATFNQARAYMLHPRLDHQAIPLLEETIQLAQARNHEEIATRGCNFLIHLYEKCNKPQDVERVRASLRRVMRP